MLTSLTDLGIVTCLQVFLKWKWDILTLGYTCLLHIYHVFQALRQKSSSKAKILCSDLLEANNNWKLHLVLETLMPEVVNPQMQHVSVISNFFLIQSKHVITWSPPKDCLTFNNSTPSLKMLLKNKPSE